MGDARGNNFGKFYAFQSKPVILDLQFQVTPTASTGTTNVRGQGVTNVFMNTSGSPPAGMPNPAAGYAWIHLAYGYTRLYSGPMNIVAPLTGSNIAINTTALTSGLPYQITAIGAAPTGAETIAPVADSAGSLASTWFRLYDSYGNTFIIWFQVGGVGSAPSGVSGTLVPVQIASGATAAQVGTALATIIAGLPSGIASVNSFTATGTTTVTVTSTKAGASLPGVAADGVIPTGFTFALTAFGSNQNAWNQVGLPGGVVPAVGAAFIAKSTGYSTGGGSSGTVSLVGVSGVADFEIVGDTNLALHPVPLGGTAYPGGWILIKFLAATSSSVTTPIATAPATTSIVKMHFLLEQATRVGGNNE